MKRILLIGGIVLYLALSAVGCSKSEKSTELTISAAASLKESMAKLEEEYKKENENVELVINYGASGVLQDHYNNK